MVGMAHLDCCAVTRTQARASSVDLAAQRQCQVVETFFRRTSPRLALADAIALEGMIFSYIKAARKVDRAAANAFIPYAAWVAFAAVLNAEILRLNPRRV
ncbi:MAG: TspO/MBR family protein, partial [Candidatus Sulfotelmatobacter sp.]